MRLKVVFYITLLFFASNGIAGNDLAPAFQTGEHMEAGDLVKLSFAKNEPGKMKVLLSLENGLELTYGKILAFPDFLGTPSHPISFGLTDNERHFRFLAAFSSFAKDPSRVNEAKHLLVVMETEKTLLEEGIKKGEKPETIYQRITGDLNRQYNCVTGGNCGPLWFLTPGRYLKLASNDFDHFGDNAWLSYQVGHKAALNAAIVAHHSKDKKDLMRAYAMNAFASHFLMDRFASGHIRMPRAELPKEVTPSLIGSLLGHFMHDEENVYGLSVHNQRGNEWRTYGDNYYFAKHNEEAVKYLTAALQASADEILEAFTTGQMPVRNDVITYLPIANETAQNSQHDITPLFYWDAKKKTLYRRFDVSNPYDKRLTSDWWGWTTAIMLATQRGVSTEWQGRLALSGYGEIAIQYGLITNKDIIQYVRSHKVALQPSLNKVLHPATNH